MMLAVLLYGSVTFLRGLKIGLQMYPRVYICIRSPHVNVTPFGNYYHSGASTVQIIGFNSFLQLTLLVPWYY